MNYYVVQDIGGSLVVYGPYKSERARDNRYDKTKGGEVHKFSTFTSDSEKVKQEFRDEEVRRL